jgi:hypothetical protein
MTFSSLGARCQARATTDPRVVRFGLTRIYFCVFLLCARPRASKFRVRLYRVEFSYRLGREPTPILRVLFVPFLQFGNLFVPFLQFGNLLAKQADCSLNLRLRHGNLLGA